MGYVFRCPKTQLVEFFDSPGRHECPFCPGQHETYQSGVEKQEGFPNVIGDELAKHFDWAAGCEINSKTQRRRIYKEKGLVLKSFSEERRHRDIPKTGTGYSYPGQKDHRSTAEKAVVRTKTGQRVI